MGDIIQLNGDALPSKDKPEEGVIQFLELALERARSGETHGVLLVETHADLTASQTIVGYTGNYSAIGATQVAMNTLIEYNE
jgi:hypothetical protein